MGGAVGHVARSSVITVLGEFAGDLASDRTILAGNRTVLVGDTAVAADRLRRRVHDVWRG